jgi:hypothetical protein
LLSSEPNYEQVSQDLYLRKDLRQEEKTKEREEINIYRPKNNVAKREMNRAKGTNLRAAAEVLGVGRPRDPPELVKKSSDGGECRGCRGGRAALLC